MTNKTTPADTNCAQNNESRRRHAERERHDEWTRAGLISLAKIPGISDKEVFALKHAFKELFHNDMPVSEVAG